MNKGERLRRENKRRRRTSISISPEGGESGGSTLTVYSSKPRGPTLGAPPDINYQFVPVILEITAPLRATNHSMPSDERDRERERVWPASSSWETFNGYLTSSLITPR